MSEPKAEFYITPETKVGKMLERFPHLEKILIGLAPEYKKLSSPILRKTIAKVASLRQIADIGKIPVGKLIQTLQEATGQQQKTSVLEKSHEESMDTPTWFDPSKIIKTLDARPLLEAGEHPVNQVLTELKKIQAGQIYALITPFLPAPMIDKIKKKGYLVWTQFINNDEVWSYFTPSN